MTHYLVTRCLKRGTPHRQYPYSLGSVELRSAVTDTEGERKAIEQSLLDHSEEAVNPDLSAARASTIVEAENVWQAFSLAAPRIDESLDVLAAANPMQAFSSYRLMEAGCARDLDAGDVTPRSPRNDSDGLPPWGSVVFPEQFSWPTRDLAQHVLSTERGDLGERYVRAAHWSRKADLELNPHLGMLFEWFAAESIWNKKKDDDVIPAIRWSLGFPNGKGCMLLSADTLQTLNADPMHSAWSSRVEDRLHRIRSVRNQTVHNGFRQIDVPHAEMAWLRALAHLAARHALHCVHLAMSAPLSSIGELVDRLPVLLERELHARSKEVAHHLQGANGRVNT